MATISCLSLSLIISLGLTGTLAFENIAFQLPFDRFTREYESAGLNFVFMYLIMKFTALLTQKLFTYLMYSLKVGESEY